VLIVGVALPYHSKPSSSQTTSSTTQVEGGAPACIVNLTNTKTIEGKSLEDELNKCLSEKENLTRELMGLEEAHNELRENYSKLLLEYNKLKENYKKVLDNMTRRGT
jgi:hypothetical protein